MRKDRRWVTILSGLGALTLALAAALVLNGSTIFATHGVGAEITPATATVPVGGTVTVDLTLTAPATKAGGWDVTVGYNASVAALVNTAGVGCTSTNSTCGGDLTANPYTVTGSSIGGLTGTVTIATLKFNAVGAVGTSTPLTVTITNFIDANTDLVTFSTVNGQISVVPAGSLGFTTTGQPGGGTAGQAWATQPQVEVKKADGTRDTAATNTITLGITGSPAGVTLTCDQASNQIAASAGVATFSGCKIDKAGTYTLTATATGLTSATSTSFTVAAGPISPATSTVSVSAGTVVSGGTVTLTLQAKDGNGNNLTSGGSTVVFTRTGGTSTGTISATTDNANGTYTATFTGQVAGTATTIGATIGGTAVTSTLPTITVTVGTISTAQSTVSVSAATVASGGTVTLTLQAKDGNGNNLTSGGSTVVFTATGGTSTGTISATMDHGNGTYMATFTGQVPGTATTIGATIGGVAVTSTPLPTITVTAGAISTAMSTVAVSAGTVASGSTVTLTLQAKDGNGNNLTSGGSTVVFTSTGGTSTGTISATTDNGNGTYTATFTGQVAGTATTIGATIGGVAVTSTLPTVTVTPGPASKLAFDTQPGGGIATAQWNQQPMVAIQDAGGNTVTTATNAVTLAITSGSPATGGPGALTCTSNPATAAGGVAGFSGCKINKTGTGYKLTATAIGLASATSAVFDVAPGSAAQVAFIVQPGGAVAGQPLSPQPQVEVQDSAGNRVTSDSATMVLLESVDAAANPPVTVVCTSTNPLSVTNGLAAFAGCKITKAGDYGLRASATGLSAASSATITITPGPASKLAFTTQPAGAAGGAAFATQPEVAVQDAFGNMVLTASNSVTLTITPATGTAGAAVGCSANPVAAVAGMASFAGCKIDKAGAGYTLTASSGTLTAATSATFTVSVGPAAMLAFTTQPGGATGGLALATQPVVTIQDAGGNTVTTATNSITVAIGTNPSSGTLSCTTNPLAAAAGVATFAGCNIDKAGTGYTLAASSSGVTGATSQPFNVAVGPAAKLAFTTQPGGASENQPLSPQPAVTIQDAGGNTATTATNEVTLAIGTNPAGGTLSGCSSTTSNGVVSFSGCKIDKAGTGYTLTASATGLTGVTSTLFNITATTLAFTSQPVKGSHTFAFGIQPVVAVQLGGSTIGTDNTTVVTLGIKAGTGTPGATLSCTGGLMKTVSAGVAAFADCKIDLNGDGYMLEATAPNLPSAITPAFPVIWAGDASGECQVTGLDFSILVLHFAIGVVLTDPAALAHRADFNGDNKVDGMDFTILFTLFATQCPTLTVTPGATATQVTVTGDFYLPNREVIINVDGTDLTTPRPVTDGNGHFMTTVTVSTEAHVIKARQVNQRGGIIKAGAVIQVSTTP